MTPRGRLEVQCRGRAGRPASHLRAHNDHGVRMVPAMMTAMMSNNYHLGH